MYAKNTGRLQERLDVYWIVHNFVRVHFTPTATSIFDMRATTQYVPPAYLVYPQEATYVTSLPDQWGRIFHSHI
jgi:hypothetical protein